MPTKLQEALRYFEPIIQEADRVLSAVQQNAQDDENRRYLRDLVARMRKGWFVLGNLLVSPRCGSCGGDGVVDGHECPECCAGVSVDDQLARLVQAWSHLVPPDLKDVPWVCPECGATNNTVPLLCTECFAWYPAPQKQ